MIVCIILLVILIGLVLADKRGKLPNILGAKEKRYVLLILFVTDILAIFLFASDLSSSGSEKEIERNSYGNGDREETFEVTVEGELENEPFTVEIGEQEYTQEETQEMFENIMVELEKVILGENESRDKIEHDLNLVTSLESYPVEIKWELDRYDVLSTDGEILETYEEEDGTLVEVQGTITYAKEEAIYVTHVMVFPETKSGKEKLLDEITELIESEEQETRENASFVLPDTIDGKEILWTKKKDYTGYYILALGIVAACLIPLKKVQDKKDEEKKRKEQMMKDYPDIISKFTLLLGTGMTLKNAWEKIVQSYDEQKKQTGVRAAYEEMRITCHEMRGGIPEKEAYERFGRRCGLVPYMKLGALLSQNLKKGSRGLTDLLKMESIQAFEERKSIARKLGEEASTKLLIPMMGMLGVVFIMIIVPAFSSLQL